MKGPLLRSKIDVTDPKILTKLVVATCGTSRSDPAVDTFAAFVGTQQHVVRRWMKQGVPAVRAWQVLSCCTPVDRQVAVETQATRYANEAIDRVRDGYVLDSWTDQGWVTPHTVMVLSDPLRPLHWATVMRTQARRESSVTQRSRVLEFVDVPTRFHGVVLLNQLLNQVDPWRCVVAAHPGGDAAPPKHQAWLSGIRRPRLRRLVDGLGIGAV